jgi:hypothetical protein
MGNRKDGPGLFNVQGDLVFLEGDSFAQSELGSGLVVIGQGTNLLRASRGELVLIFENKEAGGTSGDEFLFFILRAPRVNSEVLCAGVAGKVTGNGVLEEELFVLLRGLHGDYLTPGQSRTVPFLAGAFRRRLTHQPLRWTEARITRLRGFKVIAVPAGRFRTTVYAVNTGNGHDGVFYIEDTYPHRIVRWEWKQAQRQKEASGAGAGAPYPLAVRPEGNDRGELAGSARLSYWQLHGEGDERYLKQLGLAVSR